MGLAERYLPHYTVHDYESWQGDWELIEGVPFALASPSYEHQLIAGKVFRHISEVLDSCPDCSVVYETDWYVSEDTVVRPDIMVLCKKVEKKVYETPDLVVEVVSQNTEKMDERVKFELYEREGVPYYLLVYPEIKKVKLYSLADRRYVAKRDLKVTLVERCTLTLREEIIF